MNRDEFLAARCAIRQRTIIADELFRLALPDAWIVSGCLVQTVWNVLTGRAVDYGINDYDVFYFDPDTSWEAEDAVIRRLQDASRELGVKVEARNQARVHLWYPEKHGLPYPPLQCFDRRHRPLPDQEHAGRNPPHAGRLRGLCAQRLRRCRRLIVRPNPGRIFRRRITRRRRRWKSCGRVTVLRRNEPCPYASAATIRRRVALEPVRCARMPGDVRLPHHARGKPRLAPRRLDVLFQEAMRFAAGIAGPRIGPGPAFVVGGAGRLAGLVAFAAPLRSKFR